MGKRCDHIAHKKKKVQMSQKIWKTIQSQYSEIPFFTSPTENKNLVKPVLARLYGNRALKYIISGHIRGPNIWGLQFDGIYQISNACTLLSLNPNAMNKIPTIYLFCLLLFVLSSSPIRLCLNSKDWNQP